MGTTDVRTQANIALVHGTFAREAAWTKPESMLAKQLLTVSNADVSLVAPEWSGRNRERDRWQAADSLKTQLAESNADLHVVMGHSHGGNIGAMALHDSAADDRSASTRALITLNTPFVIPVRRSWQVVFLFNLLLLIGMVSLVNGQIDRYFDGTIATLSLLFSIIAVGGAWFGMMFVVLGIKWVEGQTAEDMPWLERLTQRIETDHDTRVLCVATADDEALGWLQFLEMMLNLPFLVIHRVALPVVLVAIGIGHYFGSWSFSSGAINQYAWVVDIPNRRPPTDLESFLEFMERPEVVRSGDTLAADEWSRTIRSGNEQTLKAFIYGYSVVQYFLGFWAVWALVGLVGHFLIGGVAFGTGLGVSALFISMFVRMRISPVPIGFRQVELVEIDPEIKGRLRHGNAYNDPLVAKRIKAWLEDLVQEAQDSSRLAIG